MSTNILSQCIYGCGACILSDKSRINDNNGVCRYARNKQKKHNYQAIEYSVAVSKIRASHKHNSTRKGDGSRRPTVGSNHVQVSRLPEGVVVPDVPYATAVGRFPRNEHYAPNQGQQINDNVEHYAPDNNAHQERYALNQKKLREETNEAKHATKAMRNESNKVKQNNEHYAPDNDEDISTVYCGSLNGGRRRRQFPISGRRRSGRPRYDEPYALIEKLRKELDAEKQANIAKSDELNQVNQRNVEISDELNQVNQRNVEISDELNQVNQRNVEISNELNRVKQINAQMRQGNQAMLAELNLVKQSYAQLQHVNHQNRVYVSNAHQQLSNILSITNHPRSG
eukprot:533570_1